MPDNTTVINQTKKWLSSVVIKHNLCPFAKREYDNNRIHYAVIETADLETQLKKVIDECATLDSNTDRETSLLIFPESLSAFEDYLDLLALANTLLETQGYTGIYQFASFHPQYCFEKSAPDDPSNYTNRSPYPMLHILRELSVETAVWGYPNQEEIPKRNIKLMRGLGLDAVKALLDKSYS